jgi:branched-chain amino acid aminotransferase
MSGDIKILRDLDQRNGFIWHDGGFVPFVDAKIHILTQSLHYASSVYEGCRIYNGKVFKLEEHVERLLSSAEMLKLKVKYSAQNLIDIINELVAKNCLTSGYVRPLIWRGSKSLKIGALDNTVEVMVAAWETSSGHFYSQNPLNLSLSRWVKPSEDVMPAQCKSSGHYTMMIVSKYEAMDQGYDDALILDKNSFIAECTTSNIFFVLGKKLYTPTTKYALNGITRQAIMSIARENGMEVQELDLTMDDVSHFAESFITGTAAEVQKISSITYQNKKIEFLKSEITEYLYERYLSLCQN